MFRFIWSKRVVSTVVKYSYIPSYKNESYFAIPKQEDIARFAWLPNHQWYWRVLLQYRFKDYELGNVENIHSHNLLCQKQDKNYIRWFWIHPKILTNLLSSFNFSSLYNIVSIIVAKFSVSNLYQESVRF